MALAVKPKAAKTQPRRNKPPAPPALPLVINGHAQFDVSHGVLLPYQKKWLADTNKVKLCEKSRRIGITYAEAADCALLASQTNGMDCWYISCTRDMAKEFIRDCAHWARFYNMSVSDVMEGEEEQVFIAGEEKKSIATYTITFASGYRITALSSSPSGLRGKQGRVIFDEAAFHHNFAELCKAAFALTMRGGQVHIISTHNGADNPFNLLLDDVRAGKRKFSIHRIDLTQALEDGLYKSICALEGKAWSPEAEAAWLADVLDFYGDDAAEELHCIPSLGGGKYLSIALIEACMNKDTPILRIKRAPEWVHEPVAMRRKEIEAWCDAELLPLIKRIPKTARCYYGHDFARKVDLTMCVPLYLDGNLVRRVPFVLEMSCIPFDNQKQIMVYLLKRLPHFMGGALDAGGNGADVAEHLMVKFGANLIEQIQLSEAWYRDHMPKMKSGFEDGTIQDIPHHTDLRDDLRAVEVVNGVPKVVERTKSAGDKKQKRHGDFAIALGLANYATFEMCGGPVKVASRGHQDSAHNKGGKGGKGGKKHRKGKRDVRSATKGYYV